MKRTRFIQFLTSLAAVATMGFTTEAQADTPQNLTSSLQSLITSTGYQSGDKYTLTFTVDTFNTTGYDGNGFYFLSMDPASSNKGYFLITNTKATQFGLSSDDNKLRNGSGQDISSWATSTWNSTTQTNSYSGTGSGTNFGVYGWVSKGSNGSTNVTSWNGTTFTVSYDGSDTSITATNNGITNSITLAGASFDVNDFAFGGDKDGSYRSGITAGSDLTFTVEDKPVPTSVLVWSPSGTSGSDREWSTGTKTNWVQNGTGSRVRFTDGKDVQFDTTSSNKQVRVESSVSPGTMTIKDADYEFYFTSTESSTKAITAKHLVLQGRKITMTHSTGSANRIDRLAVTEKMEASGSLELNSQWSQLFMNEDSELELTGDFTLTGTASQQAQQVGIVKMDEGETLTLSISNASSSISVQSIEGKGKLVKSGTTSLDIKGNVFLDTLTIQSDSGDITLSGSQDSTVGTLTMAQDTKLILAGGKLTVKDSMENSAGTIQVTQNAELAGKVQAEKVGINAGKIATFTDGLKAQGVEYSASSGGVLVTNNGKQTQTYDISKQDMSVKADTLSKVATEDVTDMNKFQVSSIVNQVGGTLWLAGMTQQETLEVNVLTIGTGSTVKITEGTAQQAQELTIHVKETLTGGTGSTLLANLDLEDGSYLNLGGGQMYLGSELTLGTNIGMDQATLDAIAALENIGDVHKLFINYSETEIANINDGDWARDHFDLSSITDADYKITVGENGAYVGLVKVSNVPEPATGTLSLLALAALAARRRRK